MASLFIKDAATVALVARVAKRSGMTKTALVRDLAAAREAQLDLVVHRGDVDRTLSEFYRRFPPGPQQGPPADKAFFDRLWGESD